MKKLIVPLFLIIIALIFSPRAVSAAPPARPAYTAEMARTGVSIPEPRGNGHLLMSLGTKTRTAVRPFDTTAPVSFQLPAQVLLTSTSTTVTVACWSQDPTPTFTRHGFFSARAGYAAGHGSCCVVPGGQIPTYCAAFPSTFTGPMNQSRAAGSMPFRCSVAPALPCNTTADCPSGTCATSGPPSDCTYLFLVSDSSSTVDVYVSEVE